MKKPQSTREDALKIASYLGCRGAHQGEDGNWMPCADHSTLMRISNRAEKFNVSEEKAKKKKKKPEDDGWENLDEGGIVGIDTLPDGSLVSAPISGKRVVFVTNADATRRMLAKDDIEFQRIHFKAQASTSRSSSSLSEAVERSLAGKVKKHNERMKELNKPDWSRADIGKLRSVFRRGVGAYKISHRPGTTENQWAMARVNAFLKILSTGKPTNLNYISDVDLLSDGHPWKSRVGKKDEKGLRRQVSFDPDAVDADNDGMVQDSTRFQRPARPGRPGSPKRNIVSPRLFDDGAPSVGDRTPAPAKPQKPKTPRKIVFPDYFKKLNYTPAAPMTRKPKDTKGRFIYKGRRYDNERYAKVHQPIQDAILDAVKKKRPDGQQKTVWVLGGPPGSYKSSLRRDGFMGIPDRDGAAHVDPDEVKEMIPEYFQWVGDGEFSAASMVHDESRDIANSTFAKAIDNDLDIVYDTSGQFNRQGRTLAEAKDKGYKVVAHYTTGDIDVFKQNVRDRAKVTGRRVPSHTVEAIAQNVPGIVRSLLRNNMFDEFYLWDTTESGRKVAVARKTADGDLEILNNAMWKRFLNGGR